MSLAYASAVSRLGEQLVVFPSEILRVLRTAIAKATSEVSP
jgi:hypothetical protein